MNQLRNKLLISLSLLLILLGVVGLTIAMFFAVIGLPVFIIGIILLFLTKIKMKIKFLIILSSVTFIILFNFIWKWENTVDPEIFLIPEGYTGRVNIIYNQKCADLVEKDGKKIYTIPNDGILLTKSKFESGFINHEYYYIDKNGSKTKLEMMDVQDFNEDYTTVKNPNEPPRDKLGVFHWGRVGTMDDLSFQEFYVSTYNDLSQKFDFKYERKFDSIEKIKIDKCKQNTAPNTR